MSISTVDTTSCTAKITYSLSLPSLQLTLNTWVVKSTKTTDSTRDISIPQDIVDIITEHGYIYNGAPNSITCKLTKVQDQLGIKRFSLHKLRHYFASRMMDITNNKTIQYLGGWKTDHVMKEIYQHAKEEEIKRANKEAMDKLSCNLLN